MLINKAPLLCTCPVRFGIYSAYIMCRRNLISVIYYKDALFVSHLNICPPTGASDNKMKEKYPMVDLSVERKAKQWKQMTLCISGSETLAEEYN